MKLWGRYSAVGAGAALAAAAADQLVKFWMIGVLEALPEQKIVVTPFFDLVMARNPGISYGLLKQESDLGRWVLVSVTAAVIVALWYWLAQVQSRFVALSLGLIIGGAVGNLIDRVRFGAVADFFFFHHWYVFNLADVAIVAGVAGLLFDSLVASHKSAGKQV
ncbi:MAG: signal peptidase II [Rhodomicrobium sp.]